MTVFEPEWKAVPKSSRWLTLVARVVSTWEKVEVEVEVHCMLRMAKG
jgi:hypothetical protein